MRIKLSSLDRREMLKFGAAGLAALACKPRDVQAAEDPYRGLKVGMHTYTLRKLSFTEAVDLTREMGVKYIGFNPVHVPLNSEADRLEAAKEYVQSAGLSILACGVIGFDGDETKARQAFEFARAMGMSTIAANPKPKSLDLLDDLVEEFDIRIAIHNHGPKGEYSTPGDLLRVIDGHHDRIGACIDIGHYERSDVRAADAIRALREKFFDMHLKDVDRATGAGKSVPLGTGIIDFEAVFGALLEFNYSGHVALEYEGTPDSPRTGVEACYAHARAVLAKIG